MVRLAGLVLLFVAAGSAIPFEDCGSLYDLRTVLIDGCEKSPCMLFTNAYVNVTTYFYASFSSDRLDNQVYFFLSNIEIDALVSKHTCQSTSSGCVLNSAELKQYSALVYVDKDLPPVNGQLVWRIFNENNYTVMCFKVAVRLQDPGLNAHDAQ